MIRNNRIIQGAQCCFLLRNNKKKYESCIRKQFGTEGADLSRGTPFKTCRLLKVKKRKRVGVSACQQTFLGLPEGWSWPSFSGLLGGWQMWELLEKETYVS